MNNKMSNLKLNTDTERIGLRRVYQSVGCSINDPVPKQRTSYSFQFDAAAIEINIGYQPSMAIGVHSSQPLFVGEPVSLTLYHDLDDTPYKNSLITEIICRKEIPSNDEARNHHKKHLNQISEFVAGLLGLTIGKEFFMKLIYEDVFTISSTKPDQLQFQTSGEVTIHKRLSFSRDEITQRLQECHGQSINQKVVETPALGWLVRSWGENDPVVKFVSLFIPLEIMLSGTPGEKWITDGLVQRIEVILNASQDGDKDELIKSFKGLVKNQKSPSLVTRFEAKAKEVNPEHWQIDCEAFKRFNGMRNALVHRGEKGMAQYVSVSNNQVVDLQELVERYVRWMLFKTEA